MQAQDRAVQDEADSRARALALLRAERPQQRCQLVIAKTSANPVHGQGESTDRELETLAVFAEIARTVRP